MDIEVCDTARHFFGKKKKELNCGAPGSSDMERAGAETAGRFGLRQQGVLNRGKGQREAGTDIREDVQCRPVQARDAEESHTQCRSSPQQPGESRLKASTRETPSVQCLELRLAAPSLHRSLGKFPSHFHPQLCEPWPVNPPSAATLTWCGRR